ncbi:MAG: hypothetical protein H6510_09655 [Acidobacteria bacterium]|nr:hypothetical protein [Acidobacteriota bacterium]MCB9398071.1 hypothetical protein [Acidobacteriota bacterium]
MSLVWLFLLAQIEEPVSTKVSVHVLLKNGDLVTLQNVELAGGMYDQDLMIDRGGIMEVLPLGDVAVIELTNPNESEYSVKTEAGDSMSGTLRRFLLVGDDPANPGYRKTLTSQEIQKIQVLSVEKLKHCPVCGYEEVTSYPYCPACGGILETGSELTETDDSIQAPPLHRLRVDEREPVRRDQ